MGTHNATFFVQVDAKIWRGGGGTEAVQSISAVALTQKRPARQRPGTVLVKLTVQVPDAVFLPLRPEAVIVIPDSLALLEPIEVEALDPTEGN